MTQALPATANRSSHSSAESRPEQGEAEHQCVSEGACHVCVLRLLCLCLYVCMCVCVCVCVCICVCLSPCACMCLCVCMYACVCTSTCANRVCVCVCGCVHAWVGFSLWVCGVCVHARLRACVCCVRACVCVCVSARVSVRAGLVSAVTAVRVPDGPSVLTDALQVQHWSVSTF